ncbi:MAG: dihydrofolate reductase family protein, partial [Clostridia bacterium]|nr:dihydrofolate reductase family protein [Clostridia bacterium]
SFLQEGMVDRVYAFLGPKLVGGAGSKSPIEGTGVSKMAEALTLHNIEMQRFEDDILITGLVLG